MVRFAAVVSAGTLCTALGCGGAGFDARAMAKRCGLDCAADEIHFRLSTRPRDRDLYVALAEIEEQRGRPGAALEALDAAERLGRAFRGGLGVDERKRLGALLVARAEVRATRGSPDADADVSRARGLGVTAPPALVRTAALAAIAGDLRHTDPRRRSRGRSRLMLVDPVRVAALAGDGPTAALAETAEWLVHARAWRVVGEMLDAAVHARGVDALAGVPGLADRWLEARRWWSGVEGRPGLLALERAEAIGAGPCWYPRDGNRCDVIVAAGSELPAGPPWEPALVTYWERDGVRAAGADQAAAWMIVARRAVVRGQLASWDRAVRDHVDVAALADDARVPRWAAPMVARLAAGEHVDELAPARVPDGLTALDGAAWTEVAVALVARDDGERRALLAVAAGYATDPALADRRAADVIAAAADISDAAPALARLFTLLGDPPRARALWQRAVDASPEDADLALGLAVAMADAGDPAAGLVQMIRAAAGYGDAGLAMQHGARGFAAAGHVVEALTLVRSAITLAAPGDEAPAAALAAALLDEIGRSREAAPLRALAPTPGAWDGRDADLAVASAVAAATRAPTRAAALARLAQLASPGADPALARRAAAALRGQLAPHRDPGVP